MVYTYFFEGISSTLSNIYNLVFYFLITVSIKPWKICDYMGADFGDECQPKLLSLAFISNSVLLHVINHGIINNSNQRGNTVFRRLQIAKATFTYVNLP